MKEWSFSRVETELQPLYTVSHTNSVAVSQLTHLTVETNSRRPNNWWLMCSTSALVTSKGDAEGRTSYVWFRVWERQTVCEVVCGRDHFCFMTKKIIHFLSFHIDELDTFKKSKQIRGDNNMFSPEFPLLFIHLKGPSRSLDALHAACKCNYWDYNISWQMTTHMFYPLF